MVAVLLKHPILCLCAILGVPIAFTARRNGGLYAQMD